MRATFEAQLQIPQHSLVFRLLEVRQQDQVGGDTSQLLLVRQPLQQFLTGGELDDLLVQGHGLGRGYQADLVRIEGMLVQLLSEQRFDLGLTVVQHIREYRDDLFPDAALVDVT